MDEANSADTLREGLQAAITGTDKVSIDALTKLVSAAFDRAALEIDGGANPAEVRAAMRWLLLQMPG